MRNSEEIKKGERMKLIKKLIVLGLALYGSLALADNCSPTLMGNLSNEHFNGLELYDYIQKVGFEVFSGAKNRPDSGINDLLATNPKVQKLSQGTFAAWQTLGECIAAYSNTKWSAIVKAGKINRIDDTLRKQELNILLLNAVMVSYSNNLNSKSYVQKLNDAINDVKAMFTYSLSQLPVKWYPKAPAEVIEAYRMSTGITFNPKLFFDAYKKIKSAAHTSNLKGNAYEAYILNELIVKNYFKEKNVSDEVNVSAFINLLEELAYQSKNYKPKYFWSSKPKDLLTQEQQGMAQEIVNLLYSLYPENEKLFIKRIALANSEQHKLPLLIFAQSRVLLIVLRAYLKTATKK